jgi:hypothetical protein
MFKQLRVSPTRSVPAPVLETLPATGTVTVVPASQPPELEAASEPPDASQDPDADAAEPPAAPEPPEPEEEPQPEPESESQPEPEPEPEPADEPHAPALLPTDVELVRRPAPAAPGPLAKTTRPDIVIPGVQDPAEDEAEVPVVDRAEDPDAGDEDDLAGKGRHRLRSHPRAEADPEPEPDTRPDLESGDDDLPIWDWNPPSSKFRSSPLPPSD